MSIVGTFWSFYRNDYSFQALPRFLVIAKETDRLLYVLDIQRGIVRQAESSWNNRLRLECGDKRGYEWLFPVDWVSLKITAL